MLVSSHGETNREVRHKTVAWLSHNKTTIANPTRTQQWQSNVFANWPRSTFSEISARIRLLTCI